MMDTITIIAHRPARVVRFETYVDVAEALARFAELRWAGASQLVMYEAALVAKGEDGGS